MEQGRAFYGYSGSKILINKMADYTGFIIDLMFVAAVILVLFFPELIINSCFKERLKQIFEQEVPGFTIDAGKIKFNIWKNRLEFRSLSVSEIDSGMSCRISLLDIQGVDWLEYLRKSSISKNTLSRMRIEIERLSLNLNESGYKLRLGNLYMSIPDSEAVIHKIQYLPIASDEIFFNSSKFRKTRLRLQIPELRLSGASFGEMLNGNKFHIKLIRILSASGNFFVDKDKPENKKNIKYLMPNELLTSIRDTIKLESLIIMKSKLRYRERMKKGERPGIITFNNINLTINHIANHDADNIVSSLNANAVFMGEGKMKLRMSMPMSPREFSLNYSGSLGKMNLSKLNQYLEKTEHIRISSGSVEKAYFKVHIRKGIASGDVLANYSDLKIELLEKETNSEAPLDKKAATLMANLLKIRHTNTPESINPEKKGKIKYTRQSDDTFLNCLWFSIRSGLGDIVGF